MKAWIIDREGGPNVYRFGEMPIPEPEEGEVQVRVYGAGMNPVDWKMRRGQYPNGGFPAVALRDFSGVVTKLGRGATRFEVGDEVYGVTERGSAAEFTAAEEAAIGRMPKSIDPAEAGLVPLAGLTAWQALFDQGHLETGQRVLIHAASGGVGTFAIQLAKWKGAYVIGTASGEHHSLLRDLGADILIDYRKRSFEEAVSDVDLVLHSIGPDALPGSLRVLRKGGRLVSILAEPDGEEASLQGKTAVRFRMQPKSEQLDEIADLIDSDQIRPAVEMVVPFEKAFAAMAVVESGHAVGKIGVRVSAAQGEATKAETEQRYMA